jgi:hypothetical protein
MTASIELQEVETPAPPLPAFAPPGTRFDRVGAAPNGPGGTPARRHLPRSSALFGLLCLASFVLVAGVYLASLTDNLSVEGDNAIYMILAKAMSLGQGYTNIQGPIPRIEAQYPPLFPLTLVPIVRQFGVDGVLQMQALVTAFALGSFALGVVLFRRWLGAGLPALVVMLATAGSDLVWSFSHKVLTEVPYTFFTLLTCWLVSRYAEQGHWRTWTGGMVVLAASAAFYTRTIGVSMCLAAPLYLLLAPPVRWTLADWRPRLARAMAVGIGVGVLCGGWTLRNRVVFSGQGHNYLGQFMLKQAYVPDAGQVSPTALVARIEANAHYYADQFQRTLGGHFWDRFSTGTSVAHFLMLCVVIGFLTAAIFRRSVAEPYLLAYAAIVLLWPWKDLRFAVPLMPFFFYYAAWFLALPFLLVNLVLQPGHRFQAQLAAACILFPLTVPGGVHTLHTAQNDRVVGYHYQADKLGDWEAYADWQDFHAAAIWLKANALPGSTVINRSPNIFYLWTGLPSRNYPYTFDSWSVMQDVSRERLDYVVADDFTWTYTTDLYMKPAIRRFGDRFAALQHFRGTTVYQVLPAAATSAHSTPPGAEAR